MDKSLSVAEAKAAFSACLRKAEAGDSMLIFAQAREKSCRPRPGR